MSYAPIGEGRLLPLQAVQGSHQDTSGTRYGASSKPTTSSKDQTCSAIPA